MSGQMPVNFTSVVLKIPGEAGSGGSGWLRWLRALIRGLLSALWDFGMWSGSVSVQRNPMEPVTIKAQPSACNSLVV
jgi:hypothetical protein